MKVATIGIGREPGALCLHAPGRHDTHPGAGIGDITMRIGKGFIIHSRTMDIASAFGNKREHPMGRDGIHGDPKELLDRSQPQPEYINAKMLIHQGLTFIDPGKHGR